MDSERCKEWKEAYLIMIATMFVDLDHAKT